LDPQTLNIKCQHPDGKATRDVSGEVRDVDKIHVDCYRYDGSKYGGEYRFMGGHAPDKNYLGEALINNFFGSTASTEIDMENIDEILCIIYREKHVFSNITTTFYSNNTPLEIIQVKGQNEWPNSQTVCCSKLADAKKLKFTLSSPTSQLINLSFKVDEKAP